jgi:hypothetical protein
MAWPGILKMMRIFRFIKALIKYIFIGSQVEQREYDLRLEICSNCKDRCGKKCCICGCYLSKKAQWSTESCPKNKW